MKRKLLEIWTYSDGGARGNPGPAAIGVVLCDTQGKVIRELSQAIGEATNNQAEYLALTRALEEAKALGARTVHAFCDSQVIVSQMNGTYRIKNAKLQQLGQGVKRLERTFERVCYAQVPRSHKGIARADQLLNQTLNWLGARGKPTVPKQPKQEELFSW